ncbi:hypothetical protein [Aurantiacibacter marinus]|uniref:Uncharacterized protein n=1 Tax=Aurantiacibacter marinus TaxID=874156 RepID=A0A0H0XMU2_9SPHN|nr:hypothetical protein [Aurantiacibacter marinus]KLI63296.1 hypothetical protein AAV99_11580 [Aurantiacibacter marinus]
MSDRYEGKPFLKLLDSYVLAAIGHLDDPTEKWLVEAEPYFRDIFGAEGSWKDIVEQRLKMPEGGSAAILEVWEKGAIKYREHTGEDPHPVNFTHTLVDTNFPH